MGRQIQIISTPLDDVNLLRELARETPIRVFQQQVAQRDHLWIEKWDDLLSGHSQLHIWPTAFPWTPEYAVSVDGTHYISNTSTAPVLELSSTYFPERRHGRLYWSRFFAAPDGLAYDDMQFSKWVDRVWCHVRRIGRKPAAGSPYVLPDAQGRVDPGTLRAWR